MALSRVWPNGVASMNAPTGKPQLYSSEVAAIDQNVTAALDKSTSGGTAYGTVVLGAGGKISLDSPSSQFILSGTGAVTSAGGRVKCGNNDFPLRDSPVNVIRSSSLGEMLSNLSGINSVFWPSPPATTLSWKWYVDSSGSIYSGTNAAKAPNGAAIIPLTRVSDGQTFFSLSVSFLVSSARTAFPPGRFPGINVFQYDPFLNVTTSISSTGWTYLAAPADLAHYKSPTGSGNLPQTLSVSINKPTNDAKYLYFLALLDEDYAGEAVALSANQFIDVQLLTVSQNLQFQ